MLSETPIRLTKKVQRHLLGGMRHKSKSVSTTGWSTSKKEPGTSFA